MLIPRFNRQMLAFAHDLVVAAIAFTLALYLRLGDEIWNLPTTTILASLGLFIGTCAAAFGISSQHRTVWAFTSVRDLMLIVRSSTAAVIAFLIIGFIFTRLEGVPRTVPFITWFILVMGLGASRIMLRLIRERRLSSLWLRSGHGRVKVLLVGTGDEADLFLRTLSSNPHAPYNVVGIVGENDKRVGRNIHGVDVIGTVDQLAGIVEKLRSRNNAPSRIVLTRSLTRFNNDLIAKLLEATTALGLSLSRLPAMTELELGQNAAPSLQDHPIALEDLLGRPETKLDRDEINALIKGRRVLVTGAGGTIGGELARQIAALSPSHLSILEMSEFNLYRIEMELRNSHPNLGLSMILANVRDAARMKQVFQQEKPDLVFHAAAIKHVPIAEGNIRETMLSNIIGTQIVADNAAEIGALAMVMISTDKAVNPSSVMGATKRAAEMYCQARDLASEKTRFVTVRFGNVLGSTGSVVPLFQEQLAKGGPLTVTHPDITRYFMTVREAVELVLQASSLGMKPGDQRGKVLVLDMGQPVKIVDLARQMIRLAGLKPDEDVRIEFTGLRAGEKLHEELFAANEELIPSSADGVQLAKSTTVELPLLNRSLSEMRESLATSSDDTSALRFLTRLVPDLTGHEDVSSQKSAEAGGRGA